ncbi:MAG: Inosine-uridine preferring nucleoside hydrolase [uncultured Thermomicrobiales bacterium]|uniref:Inosine-uridine preferring nucleoside hydrolase n=1 Tax=uncultured Thermomicrobiales bacterium TaxID=1645740 RepID=A0A6J4URR2_9BACT|nr:MAG: Inosine-uridine preferring nucleoside hydrolase [uncultured Thermomicrobiales bacterium]
MTEAQSETHRPRPAVLDTDIGTDVDDILALALLAAAPEVDLVGVTTVYGDTVLRARMARWVCDQLGRSDVTVAVGERETLTNRPVWWAGHEGEGIPDLERVAIDETEGGVAYLLRVAREHAGELHLFAIGPLTNVAAAIRADPGFAGSLHHLTIMGGAFWMERSEPEHNIKCDPEAADVVFRSGIPMSVCGLDVTTRVWLREGEVREIGRAHGELGKALEAQIRRWWSFVGKSENNPHDPLAALMAIRPDLFRFEECDVRVGLEEGDLARTFPEGCGSGTARIAAEVDVAAAERELVRRLAAGGA